MNKRNGLLVIFALPLTAWAQFGQDAQTFEALDADGNQKIDREEAREDPRLSTSFTSYDTDGNGVITKREYSLFLGPRRPRFSL